MSQQFIPVGVHLALTPGSPGRLDVLMLTGFVLAFIQVACYAYRRQSRDMGVGLFLSSIGLVVFAVVDGAWPLAMMEVVLAGSTFLRATRRLRSKRRRGARGVLQNVPKRPISPSTEARLTRLFGPPGSRN